MGICLVTVSADFEVGSTVYAKNLKRIHHSGVYRRQGDEGEIMSEEMIVTIGTWTGPAFEVKWKNPHYIPNYRPSKENTYLDIAAKENLSTTPVAAFRSTKRPAVQAPVKDKLVAAVQ